MATINAQSGVGGIYLFEDFCGTGVPIAYTWDVHSIGPFRCGGEGIEETTTGLAVLTSDGINGIGRFVVNGDSGDTVYVGTNLCLDVALGGTLALEARISHVALTTKAVFVGFTSVCGSDLGLEANLDYSDGTTVTLTAGSQCGFYLSSEFDDATSWLTVHKGGTASAVTTTTSIDLPDDDPTTGEFQVLRIEIDNNATTRWYVDGILRKTLAGAVSTTTDLAGIVAAVQNSGTATGLDIDYLLVRANRDWNA